MTIDFISHHARDRPDKLACRDLDLGVARTYAELDVRVDALAGALAGLVGEGERVAALSRNRSDLLAAQWACVRLGAIFAPLNWRLSEAEIAAQARDCAPRVVLFEEEFESRAQACGATLVRLNDDAFGSEGSQGVLRDQAEAATLLYTSGTTGGAKGVIFTETNALNTSLNFIALAEIGPDSVLLCDAPMFHTIGLYAMSRSSIQTGATVLFSSRFDPAVTYGRLIDPDLGITHYMAAPQMTEALRQVADFDGRRLARMTGILTGGAPYPGHKVLAWTQEGVKLAHGYGMSECGTLLCQPLDTAIIAARPQSSGVAGPMTEIRVVAANGRDADPGEAGEIWVRGPAVSPGYWNNHAATVASRTDGWFRTGDVAWRDSDGFYEICDRLKDMYISGGENVYPAEVEAVLTGLKGVREAAVIGVPDDKWGEVGWAFLVGDVRDEEVFAHCRSRLAGYKLPKRLIRVETLPRTVSGKVLKNVLRQQIVSFS